MVMTIKIANGISAMKLPPLNSNFLFSFMPILLPSKWFNGGCTSSACVFYGIPYHPLSFQLLSGLKFCLPVCQDGKIQPSTLPYLALRLMLYIERIGNRWSRLYSKTLDFNESVLRQPCDLKSASDGESSAKIGCVHFIHCAEILHVTQENRGFNNIPHG